MEKLPLIEMTEISNYIVSSDNYQNVFSITDIDSSLVCEEDKTGRYSDPVRLNILFMLFVLKGSAQISLDYVPYTITENTFINIMPAHVCQVAGISSDFKGRLIMMDRHFLDNINTEKRSPAMSNYMLLRKNPCTLFDPEEISHINDSINNLRDKIRMRTHSFYKEVLQNAFVGFMLELANILVRKKETLVKPKLSRKEEIMNQFLQLLFQHSKEEHTVSFYAEQLFITPQYLSLILKELTGKPANKWIDEALITEAKILLRSPQTTIQQVADQLNFSDQSTFGKFFKKQMGMSPMQYRKN